MRLLPSLTLISTLAGLIAFVACGGSTETIPPGGSSSSSSSGSSSGTSGSSTSGSSGSSGGGSCTSGGRRVANGESFSDGCNTCSCNNGSLACTERACVDAGPPGGGGCNYNGKKYDNGATFPSTDGCNTCSCEKGSVACTKKACAQDAGAYKCPPAGTIDCQPIVPPKNAAFCAQPYREWIEKNCPDVMFVD